MTTYEYYKTISALTVYKIYADNELYFIVYDSIEAENIAHGLKLAGHDVRVETNKPEQAMRIANMMEA